MINRLSKFLSYRLYPPVDLANGQYVRVVKDEDNKQTILRIEKPHPAGFYMLEYCFAPDVAGDAVCLSPLDDLSALSAISPLHPSRLNKRIVSVGTATRGWQLSVLDAEGQSVSLSSKDCEYLRFVPLRKRFAKHRMLRRTHATISKVKERAQKHGQPLMVYLYQLYNSSFSQSATEQYQRWIDYIEVDELEATNASGLQQPDVGYYFFCAPGYRMTADAKSLLAEALCHMPKAQLVYADEDEQDTTNVRKNPCFKPAWNPDLFLAQDYISACYACRQEWYELHREVFECLGPRLALSQLLPTMDANAILHLPRVLAHRIETDVDADECRQLESERHRIEVLKEALPDEVKLESGLLAGSVRARYPLPDPAPLVSLLIPTRDGLSVLKPCVESILTKTIYPHYEILILDNQSELPETLDWLAEVEKDERIRVLQYDKPFNYSAINNFGVKHAQGSVIGLINNDVEAIAADWLIEMASQAMRPEIGCVGAKLYYSNDQIQHSGVILGLGDVAGHVHRFFDHDDDGYHGRLKLVQNYSAVTAACLLVRREIYEAVGGLEEKHLTVAYNDVDFCIRVREAGYRNLWTPYAELYHHESISRGEDDTPAKQARYQKEVAYMQKTWGKQLADDPCYNPNLCRRREDFSLPDVLF